MLQVQTFIYKHFLTVSPTAQPQQPNSFMWATNTQKVAVEWISVVILQGLIYLADQWCVYHKHHSIDQEPSSARQSVGET